MLFLTWIAGVCRANFGLLPLTLQMERRGLRGAELWKQVQGGSRPSLLGENPNFRPSELCNFLSRKSENP